MKSNFWKNFWKEKPLTWQRVVMSIAFITFIAFVFWIAAGPRETKIHCSVNNMDWVQLNDSMEEGPCWFNDEQNKSICVLPRDIQCEYQGDFSILGLLLMAYSR
jgi:hypothetical protein